MQKHLKIIKKCPLFKNIEDESLLRMLNCMGATVEFYDKKYTVMFEGHRAKYIGIVLSGSVQIVQNDYYGNRTILSSIGAPQVFAEAFACAESLSLPVTVIADEPSEIMLIDCSHVLHTCGNNCEFHKQLIYNLMMSLAEKTIMFHQKIAITSKRSTREKLLTYLSAEAKKAGSLSFTIPFDRQELADYLEVERSGLSSEISKLRNEGILDSQKNNFTLYTHIES